MPGRPSCTQHDLTLWLQAFLHIEWRVRPDPGPQPLREFWPDLATHALHKHP
jgi:hypothetical protein